MFLRKKKGKLEDGRVSEYYQIIESFKDLSGRQRERVVVHLGTLEKIIRNYKELKERRKNPFTETK